MINDALSFSDAGQMKIKAYESDTFMQEMETTWQGLKPLYEQVTKYYDIYNISNIIYTNSCTLMSATSCTSPMVTK